MASKNLSIMITDLQGYSAKSSKFSRSDLVALVRTHSKLLRPVIEFYNGQIIKSLGDSFLCSFESATDACVCSIAIQSMIHEYNRKQKSTEDGLCIRVAIATGDVSIESDGDIYGEAVNLASRIEKIPEIVTGGIAISEATYLLVNRQEIQAELIGEREFKGINYPVKIYSISLEDQKLDQLPTRLINLAQMVSEESQKSTNRKPESIRQSASSPTYNPSTESNRQNPLERQTNPYWKWGIFALVFMVLLISVGKYRNSKNKNELPAPVSVTVEPSRSTEKVPVENVEREAEGVSRDDILLRSYWMKSTKVRLGQVHRSGWAGPPEIFDKLNDNGDEFLTLSEVLSRSEQGK